MFKRILLILFLVGCTPIAEKNIKLDTIIIDGSSTTYPILVDISKEFMNTNPNYLITVNNSGSGIGIQGLINGKIDIASSSRQITEKEFEEAETYHKIPYMTSIASDAILIIVHNDNPIRNLSMEQIKKIFFTGEITNWQQLGINRDKNINVYSVSPNISGTAATFIDKLAQGKDFVQNSILLNHSSDIVNQIQIDPDSIGYTSITNLDHVNALRVDNIVPSAKNVIEGLYPFSRKLYIITNHEPHENTRVFISYLVSGKGQKFVKDLGFIPIIP